MRSAAMYTGQIESADGFCFLEQYDDSPVCCSITPSQTTKFQSKKKVDCVVILKKPVGPEKEVPQLLGCSGFISNLLQLLCLIV